MLLAKNLIQSIIENTGLGAAVFVNCKDLQFNRLKAFLKTQTKTFCGRDALKIRYLIATRRLSASTSQGILLSLEPRPYVTPLSPLVV